MIDEAWELDAEDVGRAAHERWKGWIIRSGYVDHAFVPIYEDPELGFISTVCCCGVEEPKHHPDMVSWEEVPEHKRGKYVEMGHAGWLIGQKRAAQDQSTT